MSRKQSKATQVPGTWRMQITTVAPQIQHRESPTTQPTDKDSVKMQPKEDSPDYGARTKCRHDQISLRQRKRF